ncbi:MAG: LysR family transcriptional regulator [Pseudomonadota bacterium]
MPTRPTAVPLLELDLLRSLVAIAESGNFSSAAETLGRTPSAVSMQVKRMEDLVGRPLFRRDSRSVSLTRDGHLLLEHGRRLLALNRDVVSRFSKPTLSGEVRLGAPDDVAERFMPRMLRRFADEHPGVTVKVVIDHSDRMIEAVDEGELDLTIVTAEAGIRNDPGAEVIYREPLVWAMMRGGVAIERTPMPLSVWEPGCLWRTQSIEALRAEGRSFEITFESAHTTGQRAAVLADLAVAQLPVSALGDDIVEVPKRHGLPKLPNYALSLYFREKSTKVVRAAADHLRSSFGRA